MFDVYLYQELGGRKIKNENIMPTHLRERCEGEGQYNQLPAKEISKRERR